MNSTAGLYKAARVSSAVVAKSKTPTSINFVGSSILNQDGDCDSSTDSRAEGFEIDAPVVVEYHREEEDSDTEEEQDTQQSIIAPGGLASKGRLHRRGTDLNATAGAGVYNSRDKSSMLLATSAS